MRKLVVAAFLFFSLINQLQAQCPGCVIDWNCPSQFPNGGICQAVLPDGMIGMAYDQNVSFYMPQQFVDSGTGYTIDLNQITISGLSGLPFGLNWECDQSSNACNYYPPSNPPTSEMGCVKFCGTPIGLPGTYVITVYIIAQVYVVDLGINTTQNSTYQTTINVLPNSSGNPYFSFSPASGCDSLDVTFAALVDGSPNPTSYTWNFGNGSTGNQMNPPVKHYNAPGDYYVSLNTTISHYTVQDVYVTTFNNNWCGDVEEPDLPVFGCTFSPDPEFDVYDFNSNLLYTSGELSDQNAPVSWLGVNQELQDPNFTIQFWDIDNISSNDDLGIFSFNITGTGTYPFSGAGGTSGYIIVGTTPYQSYDVIDTVSVYPSPTVPVISNTSGADSICSGDTATLHAASNAQFYQWYNDTTAIAGATDTLLQVATSGNYWVRATNQYGCGASSAQHSVTIVPMPPTPSWFFTPSNRQLLATNAGSNSVQWYLNGQPINGANGFYYTVTDDGYYQLQLSNAIGCSAISDSFQIVVSSNGFELAHSIMVDNIYPNPSEGKFTIELELPVEQNVSIEVSNALGEVVLDKQLGPQRGIVVQSIALPETSKGIYFITVKTDLENLVRRILVQ